MHSIWKWKIQTVTSQPFWTLSIVVFNRGHSIKHVVFILIYLSNSKEHAVLEKQIGLQLVEKLAAFYGTGKVHYCVHENLPLIPIMCHMNPAHCIYLSSSLILSSHLCLDLPGCLFPSCLTTKTLYAFNLFCMHATCHAHIVIFHFITTNNRWGLQTMYIHISSSKRLRSTIFKIKLPDWCTFLY